MTECEKCGAHVPEDTDLTCVPAVVQDSEVAAAGGTYERKAYTKRYVACPHLAVSEVAAAGGTVNVYVLLCDLCVARLVADDKGND